MFKKSFNYARNYVTNKYKGKLNYSMTKIQLDMLCISGNFLTY